MGHEIDYLQVGSVGWRRGGWKQMGKLLRMGHRREEVRLRGCRQMALSTHGVGVRIFVNVIGICILMYCQSIHPCLDKQ